MAYPKKVTDLFGEDLFKLLGPKKDRKPWASLSFKEQEERKKNIPFYINTQTLGKAPNFTDMMIACFQKMIILGAKNPLKGIDLPYFDSLAEASKKMGVPPINYSNTLSPISVLHKNAEKQRDIFLQHILVDIVFQFQPGLVFPGIGRMDSKGRLFVNDMQHRTLACMILGIDHVPINYIESDDEYWDVQQYAAININSLQCSEFDKFRIRVQRGHASVEANLPVDAEDQLCVNLNEIFEKNEIKVVEKGDKDINTNSKVLSGIGNMIKYWKEYGPDIATRAIELNAQMFPTSTFQTANSWGLMEFLKAQEPGVDPIAMDYAIQEAIKTFLPKDNQGNKLHSLIKDTCKADNDLTSIRFEPMVIAEGIRQICNTYSKDVDWKWQPPLWTEERFKFKLDLA